MVTQIIRKLFLCVTDVCVCANRNMNFQRILVRNWHVRRQYLMEAPGLNKRIPAREPCVTDVLCNWEINSQIIKVGM